MSTLASATRAPSRGLSKCAITRAFEGCPAGMLSTAYQKPGIPESGATYVTGIWTSVLPARTPEAFTSRTSTTTLFSNEPPA